MKKILCLLSVFWAFNCCAEPAKQMRCHVSEKCPDRISVAMSARDRKSSGGVIDVMTTPDGKAHTLTNQVLVDAKLRQVKKFFYGLKQKQEQILERERILKQNGNQLFAYQIRFLKAYVSGARSYLNLVFNGNGMLKLLSSTLNIYNFFQQLKQLRDEKKLGDEVALNITNLLIEECLPIFTLEDKNA